MLVGKQSTVSEKVHSLQPLARRMGLDELACLAMVACGAGLWFSEFLLLSAALIAVGLAIAVWSPVGSFWAACAAIPLIYHPVTIGSARVSLLELSLLVTAVGVAARMLLDDPSTRFNRWVRDADDLWIWLGAAFLIVAGAISLAFQPDRDHLREAVRTYRWIAIEGVAAYFAARYVIRKRGGISVIAALAIPALVISIAALGHIVWGEKGFQADGVTRATATYMHPNNLALYLERVLVLVMGILFLSKSPRIRFWGSAAVVIGLGMAATLSRGALLGLAVGLVVISWFARRRVVVLAAAGALAAGLAGFALVASERLLGSDSSGLGGTRLHVWDASIAMVKDFPILGIGMDQFLYQHAPRYIAPEAWSERYISHPHNLLLDTWLSLGLPGLMLLIAALVVASRRSLTIRAGYGPAHAAGAASIAALAAGFAHGLVDNGYFLPDLAALTWIMIALAANSSKRDERTEILKLSNRTAMTVSP